MIKESGRFASPLQEKDKRDPIIDQKLLDAVREFDGVFQRHKQPLWVMGSMAIAAQLERPHRDIVNDVDFMTTDEKVDEVIDDLERQNFAVEEGWGTKFRAHNPQTECRGDFAIFHINKGTGNFEADNASLPASGFPNEPKTLGGVTMQPISLEFLYVMKEKAAEKSGGKHAVDLQAISDEMSRRGIGRDAIEAFTKNMKFEGMRIPTIELDSDEKRESFEARKAELIKEFKEAFKILQENVQKQIGDIPLILQEAIPENILKRVLRAAEQKSQDEFLKYIHNKFNSYLMEYINQQALKEI